MDASDIGITANRDRDGLLCRTDSTQCCFQSQPGDLAGHWYFPNGTQVVGLSVNEVAGRTVFFARNRGSGVVRLYRSNSAGIPSERGRFYCRAPDSGGTVRTVYVNICKSVNMSYKLLLIMIQVFFFFLVDIGAVTISSSGSSTAGETYSLTCSATISTH